MKFISSNDFGSETKDILVNLDKVESINKIGSYITFWFSTGRSEWTYESVEYCNKMYACLLMELK